MQPAHLMRTVTVLALGVWLSSACGDPASKRPLGASCGASDECGSGLCLAGSCVDPNADEDGDTLTNGIEALLTSDPTEADSDHDGIVDPDELGPNLELIDSDGDGKPDIIESIIADQDHDCVVDQLDPDDDTPAAGGCGVATTRMWIAPGRGTTVVSSARHRATLTIGRPVVGRLESSAHRVILNEQSEPEAGQ